MRSINKILIANRGEIAVRIMRTAQRMGIRTVAVYAENDKDAFHVSRADEAQPLGEGTLQQTYLNLEKIGQAALEAGADAIHPGYGFLSENPALPQWCANNRLLFIGPDATAIREMGDKIRSREIARDAGVKVADAITGSPQEILQQSNSLPYPVLVKASAGGGGKGMRIVSSAHKLKETLITTAREAKSYFGNETVYVEQYFSHPRHIEVQVLGDSHGNLVHLFERECSLQRRHQKVIEEAPSAFADESLRNELTTNALKLAKAIGYQSAGTVEFLVDRNRNVYFLEMNTRIQVEHPVTEKITGVDIVEEQIKIAEGRKLEIKQDDLRINGHAIQARLYAEDPLQDYRPSPGFLQTISFPDNIDIRIDHGLHKSDYIYPDYDPMIAKVISHAASRDHATEKLLVSLKEITIIGRATNQEFLTEILLSNDFVSNEVSTQYLSKETKSLIESLSARKQQLPPVNIVAAFAFSEVQLPAAKQENNGIWNRIGYWRLRNIIRIKLQDKEFSVRINKKEKNNLTLEVEGVQVEVKPLFVKNDEYILQINGREEKFRIVKQNLTDVVIKYRGYYYPGSRPGLLKASNLEDVYREGSAIQRDVIAPVHGRVVAVNVEEEMQVEAGQSLLVIESMKIENNILAEANVQIDKINIHAGEQVKDGQVLITIKEAEDVVSEKA